jgi:hypothetical protein
MPRKEKIWTKPQLVVLARGCPEENVLAACKGGTFATGSKTRNGNCTQNCANCSAVSIS